MKKRFPLYSSDLRSLLLNILIGALILLVVFMGYSLVDRHVLRPPVETVKEGPIAAVIQLDLLNGCGVNGAATAMRDYLRARGYDVVEMRNYKSFDVPESMVVDRTGDGETAEKVAYALGISKSRIIRQINHEYFVDVSVLIGKDFKSLKSSQ